MRLQWRGVHRELLDRVESRNRQLSEASQMPVCKNTRKVTPEVREAVLQLQHLEPPSDHQGAHICEVTQVDPLYLRVVLWRLASDLSLARLLTHGGPHHELSESQPARTPPSRISTPLLSFSYSDTGRF